MTKRRDPDSRRPQLAAVLLGGLLILSGVTLPGCTTIREIRVENTSTRTYSNLSIRGQSYGDLEPGEVSPYKPVELVFSYASLEWWVDGRHLTAQTLNSGAGRCTYKIDIRDLSAGHPTIEIVAEEDPATD